MTNCEMTRSQFLRGGSCLAVGTLLGSILPGDGACSAEAPAATSAATGDQPGTPQHPAVTLRPYQLLCAVCALGEEGSASGSEKPRRVLEEVKNRPDLPITLQCNLREVFGFQTSGAGEDTPEGADFNKRRDLDILLRLNLPPGVTLSARILFHRLLDRIPTVSGICDFQAVTSDAWKGCPKAKSGCYEKGCKKGIAAIIPPRTNRESDPFGLVGPLRRENVQLGLVQERPGNAAAGAGVEERGGQQHGRFRDERVTGRVDRL